MAMTPAEYSGGIRQYSKTLTNEAISTAWGQSGLFRSAELEIPTTGNLTGKRIEVDFVASSSTVANYASYVAGNSVYVMLTRGTSGSTSGTIYVTVHDD